jgi:signal recognition particle subunit SRP54
MAGKGIGDRLRMVRELQSGGFLNPGAKLAKAKQGTGKRLTPDEKRKLKKQREKDLRKRKRGDRRGGDQ